MVQAVEDFIMADFGVWENVLVSPFSGESGVVGTVLTGPVEKRGETIYLVHVDGFLGWHPANHLSPLLRA